jgi:hypothetical protein
LVKTKELKYELEVDGATFNNLKIGERKKAFISKG